MPPTVNVTVRSVLVSPWREMVNVPVSSPGSEARASVATTVTMGRFVLVSSSMIVIVAISGLAMRPPSALRRLMVTVSFVSSVESSTGMTTTSTKVAPMGIVTESGIGK